VKAKMMNKAQLISFLSDLKTVENFLTPKGTEQHKELLSKIEVIEWILE
jgi:hypothetical protein